MTEARFIELGGTITDDGEPSSFEEACTQFRTLCAEIGGFIGDAEFKGGFDEYAVFAMSEAYAQSPVQGNALAMENVAACYDQGRGVKKNVAMGTVWKIRARAARGDRHAAAWLRQNGHSLK